MIELKCPFCGQELEKDDDCVCWCHNRKCKAFGFSFGAKELWKALIETMKKLDIAVDGLKSAKTRLELINNSKLANLNHVLQIQCLCEVLKIDKALEQIKQKEEQ